MFIAAVGTVHGLILLISLGVLPFFVQVDASKAD